MPRGRRRTQISDDDEDMLEIASQPTQGRRRRVNVALDDDDDDISFIMPTPTQKSQRGRKSGRSLTQNTQNDDDLSQSQATQSRSQKTLPPDELNRLMGHVVRYVLVSDRSRHPIQRANIQKSVSDNSKHFRSVMDHAKSTLHEIFGYKLVEIDNGKYILINAIDNHDNHVSFPTEKNHMVLLFICLSHIFMNDEVCTEDNLFNFLRKLNIVDGDNYKHEYFGDVEQLITGEFIKQRYLVRSKIENSEPEKFQFQWGRRAEEELDKYEILKFVSKIYRNKPVQEWISQLKNIKVIPQEVEIEIES